MHSKTLNIIVVKAKKSGIDLLRKIQHLLIFALVFIWSGAVGQIAVDSQRTLRVVMDNNYAPYVFQSDEGKLQGILIDQWKAWEKKTGTRVDIHAIDWSQALQGMRAGEFDVIDCIVETADRQGYFDFTTAYNTVEASVYFRKDISGISGIASLKGFPIGVKTGDQHIDKLKASGLTNMILFHSNNAIIEAAKKHTINVFLADDPSALYLLNKTGIESEFRHSAPIFRDELRRAVRKGDTATLKIVSEGFAAIEPEELKKIEEKWFGLTINRYERYLRYLIYAVYVAAVAILFIVGLAVWNRTLRKKVLERTAALRQSEDRIRLIIDTIPTMAWSIRPDGTVDFFNQRWIDYSGLPLEEYIKDPLGPIHPEDIPRVMEKWRQSMTTEESHEDEMRIRNADGEYRRFLVRIAPLQDEHGNIVKWYGVSIDIEDRKRVEDELRLAYQRLSYHFENTPLAVIELNKDLFIKRWSKRAEEIFGWKAAEALGKNVYDPDFPIIYIEDIPAVDRINEQLMKGIVDRNLSHNRNYTKNGKVIYSEWYNSVLRDEQGNVITILSLVHDVTERKKTEDTLQQSYEEIRQLTEHLQKIREEERTIIAREIHDELGQHLTAIKMDAAWIDKKTPEEAIDIKRKLRNIIGLLDGSNLSIRRILSELRPRILDDNGLFEAIEWLGRQLTETTGIAVKCTMPEKDIKVSAEIATCIFRVCQEAFTNITRYASAKNVSVSITLIEKNIILTIEDDGIGFDPASIQNKKSFGILGMKERVLSLGGKFELVSSPGRGTKIAVSLPSARN
jgi:PAS domain S-box-containing protein